MSDIEQTTDPDRACVHPEFAVHAEVNRLTSVEGGPVTGYSVDLRVSCIPCGEVFRWIGLDAGSSPRQPRCSIDEATLHAPIRPASADPDFGLGLPGYAVHYREREDG